MTRMRSNAIVRRDFYIVSDEQAAALLQARDEGMLLAMEWLARLTVDWEDLAWAGVRGAVKGTLGGLAGSKKTSPTFGIPTSTAPSWAPIQGGTVRADAPKPVLRWMEELVGKVIDRIGKNKWFTRVKKVLGIGFEVLSTIVKTALLDVSILKAIMPIWGAIQGAVVSVDAALNAAITKGHVKLLEADTDLIGTGIPTIALDGFTKYVHREMMLWAGKSVYTFGKTVANILLTIFAAPIATIATAVQTVAEVVYDFIYKLYLACTFNSACNKCHTLLQSGCYVDEFDQEFAAICAACPLIGAFLFANATEIGHINLTSMLAKGNQIVSDSTVWTAGAKVYETQVLACKYITGLGFKPTFRSTTDEEQYGYIMTRIKKTAEEEITLPGSILQTTQKVQKSTFFSLLKKIFM